MVLPIVAYGDSVLKRKATPVDVADPQLSALVENMFETMYAASGVGLAAPQIGMDIRFFVVDGTPINEGAETEEDIDPSLIDFKKVFINAEIIEEDGDEWAYEEGCLSIPGVRADVYRPEFITIRYFDTDWVEHTEEYEGLAARIIQHEYDHIDGILFSDHLTSLKKQLLKKKLTNITKGDVDIEYRMKFPK